MNNASEPAWLEKIQSLYVHAELIKSTGGSTGLRDEGLLESALARPKNLYFYEDQDDIFELAAAYAEGIAQNHPFVDGNKRTAHAVAGLFLQENGFVLNKEQKNEQTTLFENLAQGTASREDVAEFYRHNTRKS